MPEEILNDISHRRYNPLRGSWLLVSPHRTKRPWQGQQESPSKITLPEYDPACYLCPGNRRAQGDTNPKYKNTFVFVNDYSAVKEEQAEYKQEEDSKDLSNLLLRAQPVTGKCYVLTFSPSHNLTLADLSPAEILPVIQTWTSLYSLHLPSPPSEYTHKHPSLDIPKPSAQYRWMQIFENKGAAMGCSNPHPHGQVWTTTGLPEEPEAELKQLIKYRTEHDGRNLLEDYAKLEVEKEERVVWRNAVWVVVCPWWAVWPFEVMVVPMRQRRSLVDLSEKEKEGLAEAVAEVTRRYDNLFETSFPYIFVYIQGGGFNTDANPNLDGGPLVIAGDHDIVVVTFNYRVGPWGFLTSKEVQGDGDLNVGLLDQRKVLEWVQKYIHLFNGDPGHVTIGGDSAGAASVDLQLAAYEGRDDGLFHAAAGESQPFAAQLTVEEAQYQYAGLVQRTGCSSATNTLKYLRDLPVATLAQSNINLPSPGGPGGLPCFMYSTVIDGNFSTDYTYNVYAQGKFVKVPVIVGDDTNEGTIFTPTSIASDTNMKDFLRNNFVNLTTTQWATIDNLYPPGQSYPGKSSYWTAAAKAYGEMRYTCPGIYLSSQFPIHGVQSSWNYHWDVSSAANNASGLGAKHTAELGSIFGISTAPDSALVPTIQAYWTSFIRTKDPNTYKLASSPQWTKFEGAGMNRLHFTNEPGNVAMEAVDADQRARCAFLSGIGPELAQ